MIALFLAGTVGAQEPQAELATFRDSSLNLQFSYPSQWKIAKKDRRQVRFEIPVQAAGTAELVVIRAAFRGTAENWQLAQKTTNEYAGRTVVRQWDQELLGAPLLLTEVSYTDKAIPMTMTTGLFYTRVSNKMLYHLRVPTAARDEVAFEWQKALETFRTLDGGPLNGEDPTKPLEPPKPVEQTLPRKTISDGRAAPKVDDKRMTRVEASGRAFDIHFPDGWEPVGSEAGVVTLRSRDAGDVRVTLVWAQDSPAPSAWLAQTAAGKFAEYQSVTLRRDRDREARANGATIGFVSRRGATASGERYDFDGYVSGADAYATISVQSVAADRFGTLDRALIRLVEGLWIRPAA